MERVQLQVRANAEEMAAYVKELGSWVDEVKKKDKKLLTGDLNPTAKKALPAVRKKGFAEMVPSGAPGPKDEERKKGGKGEEGGGRIKPKTYQDYGQWDKFVAKDLDKMIEEFDENDRQEEEAKHRTKLAEERRKIEEKEQEIIRTREESDRIKDEGNKLLMTGDYESAILKYTTSLEKNPKNSISFANRAQAYISINDYEKAVEDCNSCLEIDPRYVKAYLRRSTALLRMAAPKKDSAIADLKKVLLLEPNNKQAKEDLQRLQPPEKKEEKVAQISEMKDKPEQKKTEKIGRKLKVREVEEDSEGASEKQSNEGKAEVEKMEVKQEEKGSEGDVKSKNLGQEEEVKAAKRVISHEEAKVLAQQARDAINARISSVPEKVSDEGRKLRGREEEEERERRREQDKRRRVERRKTGAGYGEGSKGETVIALCCSGCLSISLRFHRTQRNFNERGSESAEIERSSSSFFPSSRLPSTRWGREGGS
eukprot:754070-Hanusia_phi.AAC.2